MTPRVWVRLMGTGGAANEGRHQACLLVGSGDWAAENLILLDAGGGLDVVRQLMAAGYSPLAVRDIFVSHQHLDHVGGLEPLLLWSVIRSLRERGGPPKEETRVYCEPRVLSVIERLFDAVATAAPRLFGGKLRLTPVGDGEAVELRSGARLTTFSSITCPSMAARWGAGSSWTASASSTAVTRDPRPAWSSTPETRTC